MYIDPKSIIAGLPALQVRDMLMNILDSPASEGLIAHYLKLSDRDATKTIKILIDEGYVEVSTFGSRKEEYYIATLNGSSLAHASAAKPLKRATAEKRLKEFMERVKKVNSDDYFLYKVSKVIVFGSYLSQSDRINDIDIAIELSWKYEKEEQIRRNEERTLAAHKKGKVGPTIFDRLFYPEREVKMFLKSRSRALSLHGMDDQILELKDVNKKVLYEE